MKSLISQAYIGVKTEEVQADIAAAAQKRKLIEEQTEAQLRILRAQSEAEAAKMHGLAEAQVMQAKGYTQKDVLDADVQKTFAESLGQFGSNINAGNVGGSTGSNMAVDFVGMMAGMKVAETMLGKMDSVFSPAATPQPAPEAPSQGTWSCICGETNNTKNFCMNCGQPKPMAKFCPNCGQKLTAATNFCPNCGEKL